VELSTSENGTAQGSLLSPLLAAVLAGALSNGPAPAMAEEESPANDPSSPVETEETLPQTVVTGLTREQDDEDFSRRVGVVYRLANGLAPYANYMTSFLPIAGTDPSGEPFDPETAHQYEVGVKFQPEGSDSYLGVAFFDLTREGFLTPDPATFADVQGGEARVLGAELEARSDLPSGIGFLTSYTFLDSKPHPVRADRNPHHVPSGIGSLAEPRRFHHRSRDGPAARGRLDRRRGNGLPDGTGHLRDPAPGAQ